ncbi:hypothetical protein EKI60_05355 [Candidatus Saccharibacteria bacterium]|nr:MAG: hypothetical protein EKI60_05355 [Candidatus Saccharibacteria bacterium]
MSAQPLTLEHGVIDPVLAAQTGFDLLASLDACWKKRGEPASFAYYTVPNAIVPEVPSIEIVLGQIALPDGAPNYVGCGIFFGEASLPEHIDNEEFEQVKAINCIGNGLVHGEGIEPTYLHAGDGFHVDNRQRRVSHGVDSLSIPRVCLILGWTNGC